MPVQLPKSARLERHKRRRNRLGNGKVGRVNLVEAPAVATNLLRRVLQRAVHKRSVALGLLGHGARHVLGRDGGVEDVRVRRGDLVKRRLGHAKVLGQDGLGRVGDPVVEVEGCTLGVKTILVSLLYMGM